MRGWRGPDRLLHPQLLQLVAQCAEGNPQRSAVIDVMDRGPGIPETVAAQLFRPFFTTSEHGTGLGLYIARELCRANQARLDYIPVPAGGSCFRLVLPGPHTLLPT